VIPPILLGLFLTTPLAQKYRLKSPRHWLYAAGTEGATGILPVLSRELTRLAPFLRETEEGPAEHFHTGGTPVAPERLYGVQRQLRTSGRSSPCVVT